MDNLIIHDKFNIIGRCNNDFTKETQEAVTISLNNNYDKLTKVDKDLSHLYFIGDVRLVFRGQYIDAKAN